MEIEEGQQGCQVTTPSAENITTQMEGNHNGQHAYEEQYLEEIEQRGGSAIRNRQDASGPFERNVYLIKTSDFRWMNGIPHMPTQSTLANLRKSPQYKRRVEFHQEMSESMVKKKLEDTFPYLKNRSYSCGTAKGKDKSNSTSQNCGSRIWDGKKIKRKTEGNSALYILEDKVPHSEQLEASTSFPQVAVPQAEDYRLQRQELHLELIDEHFSSPENDITSGFSGSDCSFPEDDSLGLAHRLDYDVQINPQRSPLEGGAPCLFTFTPKLSVGVTTIYATFGDLGRYQLKKVEDDYLCLIPASGEAGFVTISLQSQDDVLLGQTEIYYSRYQTEEPLKELVFDLGRQRELFETLLPRYSSGSSGNPGGGNSTGGTPGCGNLGSSRAPHVLSILVYNAAKYGAQNFIELIFNSSAGRTVFHAYKDNSTLPETIAKNNGNDEIANYLEKITKRFSEEIKVGEKVSCHAIECSELVTAVKEAQRRLCQNDEKYTNQLEGDTSKEEGYSADVESSSSPSSDLESLESNESSQGTCDKDSSFSDRSSDASLQISVNSGSEEAGTENCNKMPDGDRALSSSFSDMVMDASSQISGSSISDTSSDASSLIPDEQSGSRPPRKRIQYKIYVKDVTRAVAVGPHASAGIKGDEEVPTETGQYQDNSGSEETISMSKWSNEDYFENPEKFIQDMDDNAGPLKDAKEDFLLHSILPYLEGTWGECPSSNEEVYENLAKISCSAKCAKAVSQALHLLLHLTGKDNFDNCCNNLLVVEKIVRSSILSSEGLFRRDRIDSGKEMQELKLCVYSRIISLLVTHQSLKGDSFINFLGQDLKKLKAELKTFGSQLRNKAKDGLRYSTEFIIKSINHLLRPNNNLHDFLDECRKFYQNQETKLDDLKALSELNYKKKGEWRIDLHYIALHLQGKVRSERPIPRMETERRAMNLLRLLVFKYLDGNGGQDWRFCMLAATIFLDISMKNETKEIRTEAGSSLAYLLKDPQVRKTPECRAIIQSQAEKALFCPDVETRTFLTHSLSENINREVELDTIQHTKHLSWKYKTQTLEINDTTISRSSTCFVNHGMFQRQKVAVKVLLVKRQHLMEENPNPSAKESLKREAENLRLLNKERHANFPVLLAYDTKTLPYHLITAFEKSGDLLQFLRRSRGRNPPLQPVRLIKMLLNITDALIHLEKKGLVHRAVMATNVLVGDSYICKLSGLQHLRQLTSENEYSDSLYGYCSAEDGGPDYVNSTDEQELPLRWKAPEVLSEFRFSTASDVWALGVLMYEVLTYGCLPYRHISDNEKLCSQVKNGWEILPSERCFEEKEYQLMQQCFQFHPKKRPKLLDVQKSLCEMNENADEEQARLHPPPLDLQVTYEFPARNAEDIKSFFSDPVYEDCNFLSTEHDQAASNGLYYVHNLVSDEERAEEKSSNSDLADLPRKIQLIPTSESAFSEKIKRTDGHHLRGLLALNHANLVAIWKIDNLDSHFPIAEIITKEAPFGDLKSYVLENRCQIVDIVTFLSQVASAMHYLHVKNIIHGDLRATYVNVVTHNKIQVGRLGRSKPLSLSEYEDTSTLCVVQAVMPPESTRWSAPEVILDGHYTHASDVWSFGILAWELYTSFADGLDGRDSSLPFFGLKNQEILPQIRHNGPPTRPEGCPEWVHIIMHQCWAYVPQQRPPFLAVFDCLTSREPMKSWIMKLWLQNHDKSKWPDLSIRQPQDACHVTNSDQHPSSDVIEKMCSPDFFSKHEYKYVSRTFFTTSSDDDYSKAYGTSDMQVMRNDLEYQTACGESTMEVGTPELVPVPEPQKTPNNDESGYLCPVSIKIEDLSSIESNQANVSGVADFPRSHEQKNVVSSTGTFYLQVKKVKKRVETHDVSAIDANEDKVSLMDDKPHLNYVNLGPQLDQHHAAFYQNIELVPKEGSCELEEDAKKAAAACEKPTEEMNGAVYCKVKKTKNPHELKDQLVPLNHQLYANVDASSVTTHALPLADMGGEQSDMETIHKEMEAEQNFCQTDEHSWNTVREKYGAEKNGSNSSLSVWLKDPELEVVFYV